jgi:hypothetical protein
LGVEPRGDRVTRAAVIRSQLRFRDDREEPTRAIETVASGRGWCNVVSEVVDDVPDLRVNVFGLWVNRGAAVATLVTAAPIEGVAQPSTLGLLHSRGRLGRERIGQLTSGAPFVVKQDHSQRGLLMSVPPVTASSLILDVMCSMTEEMCDFPTTGRWRLDLFVRS